jgi:hypothetical protein
MPDAGTTLNLSPDFAFGLSLEDFSVSRGRSSGATVEQGFTFGVTTAYPPR